MNEEEKKITGEIDISKTIESNIDYWRNKCFEQQKEIEKLKDKLKEERNFNKSALETLKECIHKDTIRKKLDLIDKEYAEIIEKNKNDLYLVNINAQRHSAMQLILEELLGE